MKPALLEYLRCPSCGDELRLVTMSREGEEVVDGRLRCGRCSVEFPIRGGIPRMLKPGISAAKARTARAFGWQWQHFTKMYGQYEAQFLDWISPIGPEFFHGKVVLDAGCGIGRHAFFAAQYGSRAVIGIDLSDAVETAQRNIGHLPNAHVIQADLYDPPFGREAQAAFDFVYSIGVLHHLPDPEAGIRALVACLKPGGTFFGWVYGYENNAVVHHLIDPFRRHVTTRLPPPALQAVAFPLALAFHAAVKGVYRPLRGRPLLSRLPANAYIASLSDFSFRQNYNIVFDQLVAPTAVFLRREEFERSLQRAGLEGVELSWRNQNSWRGRGRAPQLKPG